MKKYLFLPIFLLLCGAASAQLPTLTTGSEFKVKEGNNSWYTTIADLAALLSAGAGTVTSVDVSGGSTGITTSGGPVTSSGTITLAGTLDADNGGTGFASYAVGDILYAATGTTLAKLADVATGNALISGGVTTAPAWGKIGLATHVSGTLPVANGGTNLTAVGGAGTVLGSTGSANAYLNPTVTTADAVIGYTLNGANLELNVPDADGDTRGTMSATTQTLGGAKTWNALGTFAAGATSTAAAGAAALYANGVEGGSWVTDNDGLTLDQTHNYIEITSMSESETYALPACNSTRNGWEYVFNHTGTAAFGAVIDPNGSEQFVGGATTKTIYPGVVAKCKCRFESSTGTWFFEAY